MSLDRHKLENESDAPEEAHSGKTWVVSQREIDYESNYK